MYFACNMCKVAVYCIYVWIFENSVEFEAKLFRLPTIAGREPFAVLEKAEGLASSRVGAESPGAWLPAATMGGAGIIPWGVGRVAEWLFCSVKVLIFFAGQTCPAGLVAESQPVRHKQGGWVGCVLTDCLWLTEGKILCIFWEKCQGGSVDINTISRKSRHNYYIRL